MSAQPVSGEISLPDLKTEHADFRINSFMIDEKDSQDGSNTHLEQPSKEAPVLLTEAKLDDFNETLKSQEQNMPNIALITHKDI